MAATSTLEAVNIMLSVIGESPVNSLDSGLVEAELAESILASTNKAVQSSGWNFNRELAVPYTPDINGFINLPTNILRADATKEQNSKDLVQRGLRMYDRGNHTFKVSASVNLDTVVELDFEEIPEVARRYITIKAARVFQDRVLSSDSLHGFNQVDEDRALFELREFESDAADYNIFNNYDTFSIINR